MSETVTKGVIALILAALAAYFRELLFPIILLIFVMIVDYVSGMMEAWINKKLSSRVGIVGIMKKVGYLFAVAVAVVVDLVTQMAAEKAGIDLGGLYAFGLLVTIWLILNECISILENISEMGVEMPPFLLKLVEKLKKTTESKGEEATEK